MNGSNSPNVAFAIVANFLVVAVGAFAYAVLIIDENFYYLSVQEDEYVEWTSVWAFVTAAVLYGTRAVRPSFDWRHDWFLLGLAAFSLFVALEEISWGQRIIGYRPPEYFLATNFQQELNIHNVVASDLRKLALQTVILGYGVALPAIMLLPVLGDALRRIGFVPPPATMMPAYFITGIAYIVYPLDFTGEWVELMLGLCFMFSALARPSAKAAVAGIAWAAVIAAGIASATITRLQRDDNPDNAKAAETELEALRRDFTSNRARSRCGVHKRLFTFVQQYRQGGLLSGEFANLTQQGLPEQRAEYLLDPWNYAYWLRDNCAAGERSRVTYLYSFGPNRRRDSTKWEIGGDDIAVFIRGSSTAE